MDGIFGIGVPEVIIVVLALFIVGGPENVRKWAYELGRGLRQLRRAWTEMMKQMEQEMGPEGKEVMEQMKSTAEEVGQGLRDLRGLSPTRNIVSGAMRLGDPDEPPKSSKPALKSEPKEATSEPGESKKYPAWLPPDDSRKS